MADQSKESKSPKFTPNVADFLCIATRAYGNHNSEVFCKNICAQKDALPSSSPIEDLFFIAAELQREIFFLRDSLSIKKQVKIGSYRVDFLLIYQSKNHSHQQIIVELDGHEFHETSKHQRSYEKARDRFLIKSGYKVLHFTGSDVCSDPHKVVFEALLMLGVPLYQARSIDDIDPNDKLYRR